MVHCNEINAVKSTEYIQYASYTSNPKNRGFKALISLRAIEIRGSICVSVANNSNEITLVFEELLIMDLILILCIHFCLLLQIQFFQ